MTDDMLFGYPIVWLNNGEPLRSDEIEMQPLGDVQDDELTVKVKFTIEEIAWDNSSEVQAMLEQILGPELMQHIRRDTQP